MSHIDEIKDNLETLKEIILEKAPTDQMTGASWNYLKVAQKDYEELRPDAYSDLMTL